MPQKTHCPGYAPVFYVPYRPYTLQDQKNEITELTVIYVVGIEKLKGKKHIDVNQKHELF